MISPRLSHLLKSFYSQLTRLSWWTLLLAVMVHYAISAKLIWFFESGEITEIVAFFYYYVTTVTTVCYGDLAPKSAEGRLVSADGGDRQEGDDGQGREAAGGDGGRGDHEVRRVRTDDPKDLRRAVLPLALGPWCQLPRVALPREVSATLIHHVRYQPRNV